MHRVPAFFVLRIVSAVFGVAGLALLALGAARASALTPTEPQFSIELTLVGVLILLVGVAGPLRIIASASTSSMR